MRFLSISAIALSISFPALAESMPSKRHVILIGIDGVRRDAFQSIIEQVTESGEASEFSHVIMGNGVLDDLMYAGRDKDGEIRQATFSGPGWVTILSGVWAGKHHIEYNTDINDGKYNREYPTIFNYIKDANPDAVTVSFTDWEDLQKIAGYTYSGNDSADINQFIAPLDDEPLLKSDDRLTKAVLEQINSNHPPDFIFTHYELVDDAGHSKGFSPDVPDYMQALKQQILYINTIAKAIEVSRQKGNQWLVIIATDHGGHGWFHGTQKPEDQDIFAVFQSESSPYRGGISVSLPQDQVMFVPTILDYLGLSGDTAKLDGEKFVIN